MSSISELLFATIAIIATIVPIICQTISTIILSYNNIKIEKLKHFNIERIKALNNFIDKSNIYFSCAFNDDANNKFDAYHSDLINSFLHLQIYFKLDSKTQNRMFQIERIGDYEDDIEFRNQLVLKLSKLAHKYVK